VGSKRVVDKFTVLGALALESACTSIAVCWQVALRVARGLWHANAIQMARLACKILASNQRHCLTKKYCCAHTDTSAHTSRIFQTVARNSCGIPDHASLRRVSSTQYTWCNAMRPMLASSTPTASVTYDIPRSTLGVASRVLNLCSRRGTGAEPDGADGGGSIELPEPLLLVAAVASSTAPIACSVSNEALHAIIASTREREIERDCHNIAHNQQGGQQRLGTSTPNSRHANRDTSTR
jgi:hypothetical protein